MRATCPANPEHKRFITTQHVMEEVIVDEEGDWLETLRALEVSFKPDPGNLWNCAECDTQAVVT